MQLHLRYQPDCTLVPNRFIECCANAPEKHIATYLLALKHASQDKAVNFDILCTRLAISNKELLDIFEYWQKKGLARIVNGTRMSLDIGDFEPVSAQHGDELYTEREFNQKLQSLFGSRQLSPHDYLKIYDYTDTFGLGKKVVLALVEYCILKKGPRVSITYIDKVAQAWAEDEHIDTEEKARQRIEAGKAVSKGIPRVLRQLGLSNRSATQDEIALFEKWTGDLGFTLDAILTACAQTTAAREPSFKYLDKILERLHARGLNTSRTITEAQLQSEDQSASIKEVLHMLGAVSLKPTFEQESLYQKWISVFGFDQNMIVLAAKHIDAAIKNKFAALDSLLTDWYNNRVMTMADARRHIAGQKALDEHIISVFETAGISKMPTDAHRKIYTRWHETWSIGHDAILLAAEISTLSDNPYRYLNTILSNWHAAGIKTLTDAQREQTKHIGGKTGAARAPFERPVEKYDHLVYDPFADEGA